MGKLLRLFIREPIITPSLSRQDAPVTPAFTIHQRRKPGCCRRIVRCRWGRRNSNPIRRLATRLRTMKTNRKLRDGEWINLLKFDWWGDIEVNNEWMNELLQERRKWEWGILWGRKQNSERAKNCCSNNKWNWHTAWWLQMEEIRTKSRQRKSKSQVCFSSTFNLQPSFFLFSKFLQNSTFLPFSFFFFFFFFFWGQILISFCLNFNWCLEVFN